MLLVVLLVGLILVLRLYLLLLVALRLTRLLLVVKALRDTTSAQLLGLQQFCLLVHMELRMPKALAGMERLVLAMAQAVLVVVVPNLTV
jgi:hypothetical protein